MSDRRTPPPVDALAVFDRLDAHHPDADTELVHRNAYELLVATILSAQCTDARVNQVTPALFAQYPDARALAAATPEALEPRQLLAITVTKDNLAGFLVGKDYVFNDAESITVSKGVVVDEAVCLEDLMPTLLDLAGVPIPATVEGRSLVPFLRGQTPVSEAVQGGRAISVTGVRGGVDLKINARGRGAEE